MELFLSINKKFYQNYDDEWINLFLSYDIYNIINGCELYVDFTDKKEIDYVLKQIKNPMYNSKWKFQFHAPSLTSYLNTHNSYLPMLKYYDEISQIVGYPININFHPIESKISIQDSITRSKEEFNKILNLIQKYNFKINPLVENLNKFPNVYRCNLQEINPLLDTKNINLTWDIGHLTVDNKYEYNLSEKVISKLRNIHLHDTFDKEHFPFYNNKLFLEQFFNYINHIKYDGIVVAEIALDYMGAESFNEKILEYTRNMHILSYYYNSSKTRFS